MLNIVTRKRHFAGLAGAFALASAWAAELPPAPVASPAMDANPQAEAITAYRAMSDSRSRHYDRIQDMSARQMLILLEVCERTGANLGQTIATGEFESAHTWNDHVRPTLNDGSLGAATGVWQFMPGTFHHVMKAFGSQLLAASDAHPAMGRERLDLGDGPFADEQVRRMIQETVDGKRGEKDPHLQLLRHNFAVLAFARHYLSVEAGAATPEEDYLYHFLGAREGRRILALARGPARNTLSVKPRVDPASAPAADAEPALASLDDLDSTSSAGAVLRSASLMAREPMFGTPSGALGERSLSQSSRQARARTLADQERRVTVRQRATPDRGRPLNVSPEIGSPLGHAGGSQLTRLRGLNSSLTRPSPDVRISATDDAVFRPPAALPSRPAIWSPALPETPPPISSAWGLAADSATVTGNLGMFYRDGKGRSQPYTWGEFLDNLGKRVQAKNQPALVRAKYAVGFALKGGDMPERAFDPGKPVKPVSFRHEINGDVRLPEAMITGPLDRAETSYFKRRLAQLIGQGEAHALDALPPESALALQHLDLLPAGQEDVNMSEPSVRKALQGFRKMVGKDAPDDPNQVSRLMVAERVALEIYDRRLSRYAAIQAAQQASLGGAVNLGDIKNLPEGLRTLAAPQMSILQDVLAAQGLLKQPMRKIVWRDKKRKKHVRYEAAPFVGTVGKATMAALASFQWRNGLKDTDGVADGLTLAMLGLPSMGAEIFQPLEGPQCVIADARDHWEACEVNLSSEMMSLADQLPPWRAVLLRPWETTVVR